MKRLPFGLLLLLIPFAAAAAPEAPAPAPLAPWLALKEEALGIIAGEAGCGPVSHQVGFCREDGRESPTLAEAALSDACRGQPAAVLDGYGRTPADLRDRRAAAQALRQLFAAPPFGPETGAEMDRRTLLKTLYDRDQALRYFQPAFPASNAKLVDYSRWVAICAHALVARAVVDRVLTRTSLQELAADPELAEFVWIPIQHSDFDPNYQLRMSGWFGSADAPHMKKHSGYLYDRAMVGLHRAQRFGTQIRCNAGAWAPFPVEDPANLDARRATLGLVPMAEYLARPRAPCPPPQAG